MTRVSDDDGQSTRTWRWVIVLAVLPAYLFTVLLTTGGLWMLVRGSSLTERGLGLLLLGAVYVARPRVSSRPPHVAKLTRGEAPQLFELVAEVARVAEATMPSEILVVPDFNAFATRVGWRRTRVVGIGAPLWVASTSQQRVALLGHELSHFANKDISYGVWVGTALQILHGWYITLNQRDRVRRPEVQLVQAVLLKPLGALVAGYILAIRRLAGPSRQRQEYLADIGAARAAGSDAAIEMLDVLLADAAVSTAITRSSVSQPRLDMWESVVAAVADRSPNVIQGRRRTAEKERNRIDASHPATYLRIKLLEQRPRETARVVMDSGRSLAIERELRPAEAAAARWLGDRARYQR